ncbi:MAG: hypothetical protein KAS32_19580 [Candidatus Peribacteraceae bacterium]|nr:hypothetical protein [Candidatus Peribacteraceae bacterium]
MFGQLVNEMVIGSTKVELYQKADGDPTDYKLVDGKFFLMFTVNDILISQPEIGSDEAKIFSNACEQGVVNLGKSN